MKNINLFLNAAKMKKYFATLLLLAFLLLGYQPACQANQSSHGKFPALVLMQQYEAELPYMDFFEPYTVCILALNELSNGRMVPEVKNYINWYFDHLNYPDKHGLTGTIYDYVIRDGQERATRKYDSIDGYSGIFLHLLNTYVTMTGDVSILRNNWEKIEDIAYTIVFMQDENDGLTRALPTTDQKYLMDNCESYGGIKAFNQLRKHLGMERSKFYDNKEKELLSAVLELYNYRDNTFTWVIEDGNAHSSDWRKYYPDAYAQLFPVYYGVLDSNWTLAENFLYNFNLYHEKNAHQFPIEQRIIYELTRKKMSR